MRFGKNSGPAAAALWIITCVALLPGSSPFALHLLHAPARPGHALFCRESEVRNVPLMGDREPLDALAAEYAAGSTIYRQKIDRLKQDYGSIRWGGLGVVELGFEP